MKFSVSYPTQGTTKSFQVDDDNKCRVFFEKRMGQEVEADNLGEQFKGYVFKINGGFDKDGFAMKQGIFSNGRVRLLLAPGSKGYRAKRVGERKRRSIRGCIVGPDIRMLSCTLVKKGDKQIPGLTDQTKPRRLGPKRAAGIRKLYGISKAEGEKTSNTTALLKKNVIRRTFKSKANGDAPQRHKAPKIQRLITDVRLRRKKIQKDSKIRRWKKSLAAADEYKKMYDSWLTKKRNAAHEAKLAERKASKVQAEEPKKEVKKVPAEKQKRVELPQSGKQTGGATVVASITKVKKVVKKKE